MPKEGWREMTDAEIAASTALAGCRFTPGCFDKRFARSLYYQATSSEPEITDKQAALLPTLLRRYRRQIPTWERLATALLLTTDLLALA